MDRDGGTGSPLISFFMLLSPLFECQKWRFEACCCHSIAETGETRQQRSERKKQKWKQRQAFEAKRSEAEQRTGHPPAKSKIGERADTDRTGLSW